MSFWRAIKPVLFKTNGYAVAGGSKIALCADINFMAEDVGPILRTVPADVLDYKVEEIVHCPTSIPVNQLAM